MRTSGFLLEFVSCCSYLFRGSLQLNEWQHVAFVWDREALKGRTYINGDLTGKQHAHAADNGYGYDLVSSNHTVYDIGLKRDSKVSLLGYLRDLLIIKRALAANEVHDIYVSGKSCIQLQE